MTEFYYRFHLRGIARNAKRALDSSGNFIRFDLGFQEPSRVRAALILVMEDDTKLRQVAEILIGKHGRNAAAVARERAHDRLDRCDYSSALVWVRVSEATSRLLDDVAEGSPAIH